MDRVRTSHYQRLSCKVSYNGYTTRVDFPLVEFIDHTLCLLDLALYFLNLSGELLKCFDLGREWLKCLDLSRKRLERLDLSGELLKCLDLCRKRLECLDLLTHNMDFLAILLDLLLDLSDLGLQL